MKHRFNLEQGRKHDVDIIVLSASCTYHKKFLFCSDYLRLNGVQQGQWFMWGLRSGEEGHWLFRAGWWSCIILLWNVVVTMTAMPCYGSKASTNSSSSPSLITSITSSHLLFPPLKALYIKPVFAILTIHTRQIVRLYHPFSTYTPISFVYEWLSSPGKAPGLSLTDGAFQFRQCLQGPLVQEATQVWQEMST